MSIFWIYGKDLGFHVLSIRASFALTVVGCGGSANEKSIISFTLIGREIDFLLFMP